MDVADCIGALAPKCRDDYEDDGELMMMIMEMMMTQIMIFRTKIVF